MFLNLSNHPSSIWSKEQIELAKSSFGEVVDMPFPHIAPLENTEGVVALAEQYCQKILQLKEEHKNLTVHLMGELSFCFALVKMLQNNDVKVVCSTTERIVIEEKEGLKTVRFQFYQFREYP